jgi:hypothetical protein
MPTPGHGEVVVKIEASGLVTPTSMPPTATGQPKRNWAVTDDPGAGTSGPDAIPTANSRGRRWRH